MRIAGRDGFHVRNPSPHSSYKSVTNNVAQVSHFRWAIPLGRPACAETPGQVPQLAYWMALDSGLASCRLYWNVPGRHHHPKLASAQRLQLCAHALAGNASALRCPRSDHGGQYTISQALPSIRSDDLGNSCPWILPRHDPNRCSCA